MEGSVLSFLKAEWKVSDTEPLINLLQLNFFEVMYRESTFFLIQ